MEATLWPYGKCLSCANKNYCVWSEKEILNCMENGYCNFSTMTNADHYRSYSDEELAELFNQIETEGKAYGPRGKAHWLEWLRQEATP